MSDLIPASPILFFFFNDTATTEIYTLSLHDALPISLSRHRSHLRLGVAAQWETGMRKLVLIQNMQQLARSEEHTSELQSRQYLVCRLLLEKKNLQEVLYQL